jgi:hypothetical protein
LAISLPPTRHGGLPKVKGVHIKKDEAKSSDLVHSPDNKIEEKGKGKKDSNKQQSSSAGKGKKKMHQVGDTPKKSKDKATSAIDFVKEQPPLKLSPAAASDVTASSSSGGTREPAVGEKTVGYSRDRKYSNNSTDNYFPMIFPIELNSKFPNLIEQIRY